MTLSIGKYCAGTGSGARRVDVWVMAIPGCAVVPMCSVVSESSVRGGGGQPLSFRTS